MKYVGDLQNLEFLDIASSVDDRGLEHIQRLSGLRELWLHFATRVSDKGMASLKFWKKLTTLDIYRTNVTDEGLEYLYHVPALEILFLPSSITDKGLGPPGKLAKLRFLDISETQVTDSGLAQLKDLGNKIGTVHRGMQDQRGKALKHLGNLKNLRKLNIGQTRITDDDLGCVCALTGIEELYLNGLKITERRPSKLVCLPRLRCVGLERTMVTQKGVSGLRTQSQGSRSSGGVIRFKVT